MDVLFSFLQSDINDVNTIFMDLGALVHNQGEIIDSIEAQVETAQVSVSMGTDNLRKASGHAVSISYKRIIL